MGRLNGKVAIVTGAGAGIGKATALLLAKEGANVCCASLSGNSGARVVQEIWESGGDAIELAGDLAKMDAAEKIVHGTINKWGKLDILVNNAGIVISGKLDETAFEPWDRVIAVNLRGTYLMSWFALDHLKKTQGVIVNVSSSVALKGVKDRAAYTASKGAVLSLTRAMAVDYAEDKVRVNCICPGTTDTPSLAGRISKLPNPDEARKSFIARQPLGRFGRPEEIAEGILFLVTNEFCTGTILSVDGGMTM
jgi:NAD(P)-dependent dehydrogenase (short-subunit alcohol dehydrogenase family)